MRGNMDTLAELGQGTEKKNGKLDEQSGARMRN
jgi:hypothetical protein